MNNKIVNKIVNKNNSVRDNDKENIKKDNIEVREGDSVHRPPPL